MIKIRINNHTVLIDLYEIDFNSWMRISDLIIEKYGFNNFIIYTYEVVKHNPYISDEYTNGYWN